MTSRSQFCRSSLESDIDERNKSAAKKKGEELKRRKRRRRRQRRSRRRRRRRRSRRKEEEVEEEEEKEGGVGDTRFTLHVEAVAGEVGGERYVGPVLVPGLVLHSWPREKERLVKDANIRRLKNILCGEE